MKKTLIANISKIFSDKLGWKVESFETKHDTTSENVDGQIKINIDQGFLDLVYEIRRSVIPSSIPSIRQNFETLIFENLNVHGAIILANYISTKAREILHQNNINYADTGGNIFLKYKNIHIYIETGQSDRSTLSSDAGRAFTKAGLKVLFQFFRSENRRNIDDKLLLEMASGQKVNLNSSYQHIAEQASVSKDTVSKVMLDLLEQGFILRKNSNEFTWKEKRLAFERWVSRINEILRPTLTIKKYRLIGGPISLENIPSGYQMGGYYGAQRWLELDPSQAIINAPYIIYCHNKGLNDVFNDLKIVPDSIGNVTVIEAFWKDDSNIYSSADFPVLYADLVSDSNPRLLEIAHLIHKNYIDDHL